MKVLVLGGTQFIGTHLVHALLARGDTVTVFNRGRTADALPAAVRRVRGDRDTGADGLAALPHTDWDAVFDLSGYRPMSVRASAARLTGHTGRYVFFSAVMAHGPGHAGPVSEQTPRLPPAADDVEVTDGASYGGTKVACEDLLQACFGELATVLRPQAVVGPGDPTLRYTHWVQRARAPRPMLVPGDGSDLLQVLDVRDLAAFACTAAAQGLGGAFDLGGPRLRWDAFVAMLGPAEPVWVPRELLEAAPLDFNTLPLWRPAGSPLAALMHIDSSRALAHGLRLTPAERTLADVRAWCQGRPFEPAVPPALEDALIAQTRARQGHAGAAH